MVRGKRFPPRLWLSENRGHGTRRTTSTCTTCPLRRTLTRTPNSMLYEEYWWGLTCLYSYDPNSNSSFLKKSTEESQHIYFTSNISTSNIYWEKCCGMTHFGRCGPTRTDHYPKLYRPYNIKYLLPLMITKFRLSLFLTQPESMLNRHYLFSGHCLPPSGPKTRVKKANGFHLRLVVSRNFTTLTIVIEHLVSVRGPRLLNPSKESDVLN